MNRRVELCWGIGILLLFFSCGPKMIIPPKIDLTKYDRIGLIGFGCNAQGNMDEFVTRRFLMTIRSYQKKARIIELGTHEEVLESVQANKLDSEAIRAIGQKYDVNPIFTGNLEVTEVQPLLVVYPGGPRPTAGVKSLEGKRVNAMVKVWVTARLWDTQQGATFWRTSTQGEEMVKKVKAIADGEIIFEAREPLQAFWDLINPLVKKICADFKIKRVRIPQISE